MYIYNVCTPIIVFHIRRVGRGTVIEGTHSVCQSKAKEFPQRCRILSGLFWDRTLHIYSEYIIDRETLLRAELVSI